MSGIPVELLLRALPPGERRRMERALHIRRGEDEHAVFVYGFFKSGGRDACWAHALRRHAAWTFGRLFDAGRCRPSFVRDREGRVRGELLAVDETVLRTMDGIAARRGFLRRQKVEVMLECGGRRFAWIYTAGRVPPDAVAVGSEIWRGREV